MELLNVFLSIVFMSLAVAQIDPEIPNNCPKDDSIAPCTCKPDYDGSCIIQCYAVSVNALRNLAKQPNLCDGSIDFKLVHSKVPGIPTDLWKLLLTSKSVDVTIQYSRVDYVVPPGDERLPALSTSGSAIIKVAHSKDISNWDWSQFHEFRAEYGTSLIIDDTPITELKEDFSGIAGGKIRKVAINRSPLDTLPDKIFSRFEDVTSISFQDNELMEVQRSMFPKPAARLQYIHLNGNNLESIPADLFTDMPSLQIVYLRENELSTLPTDLFNSINSRNVRLIDLVHNPWHCDCDLWNVTDEATGYLDMGYCASPENMIGKKADHLLDSLNCLGD